MSKWTEKDIENLIRNSVFSNPLHKNTLRERLFETDIPLDPDDLDAAAGGVTLPEPEGREPWQMSEEDKK